MPRWDGIEAFVEVVRLGTFAAAARQLQVSNSHISRQVARLEQQLGLPLLYRTTRKIRLTEAGERYYTHCRQLLDGFRNAETALQALHDHPQGTLRLSSATTFGERFIAPLANDFLCRHPQLDLRLHLTNRQVDIIDEGYDVVIRMGTLQDSSLIARRLCARREYVVGSPAYFTGISQPHSLAELAHHRCLIGSRDQWRFDVEGVHREVRVQGPWQANSGPALLDAALKGLGLAQLPDYYVAPYLASGELLAVLAPFQCRDAGVWAVMPSHRQHSPKVRQFVDFLVDHLPGRLAQATSPA
ncbi:LysR family transcriptional regulator [Halomonas campisalis]|uniref:LysR family transcriptional regulator n=1 Tax=Billgrantia campisalis TaxID=74661 RepID=A0ABS9P7L3_9GAMM|nr:LysR family transcriptional regulator [Halomonas campisalis]MCG6657747.1 LysR family transcriptional regulator [Halomonas campisalis]MDR5862481.1 LysR family transcriptional regulator [Halomonas campisalis]